MSTGDVTSSSSSSSSDPVETLGTEPTSDTGTASTTSAESTSDESATATTTTSGVCGDGSLDDGEVCDDGNDNNNDACTNSCELATCGDGYVREGFETCDDGNDNDGDACLTTCESATCGDGYVYAGVEECDDANDDPFDDCDTKCIRTRKVFITTESFQGDFGGMLAADLKCQELATIAELPNANTFKAWLADETGSPATRFHHSTGRYALVTGIVIALNWADLADGSLASPIVVGEDGSLVGAKGVFTNTTTAGELLDQQYSCDNWSKVGFQYDTWVGYSGATDHEWVDAEVVNPAGCSGTARLYCVEQ